MEPHIDARLQDGDALEEIELYADVLIAAAGAERPLSTDELDRVLGVHPRAPRAATSAGAAPPGRSARSRRPRKSAPESR
ncbi:hypothetical protein [Nocardiopsis baichengensis]|uniref:hypothetical protein n=1 Tax=Nocardiopsis baichengensis TaxID=280240 RepID=UPI000347565C|nr:hypothetical protein [Nocardiopsis baichengensis]